MIFIGFQKSLHQVYIISWSKKKKKKQLLNILHWLAIIFGNVILLREKAEVDGMTESSLRRLKFYVKAW